MTLKHNITIKPANIQYSASTDITLLDAALASKYPLQYSCKKGSCGTCVAQVITGAVKNENSEVINTGSILTCCSYALTDVSLKANYYVELANIECVTVPCKIANKQLITADIMILSLRLPPTTTINYLPGQYIDLIHGNIRRSYSIANAPISNSNIELHIRLFQDGEMSQALQQSTLNQLMRIEGPKGTFFIRQSEAPIIFIASGTGFAPVKAMIENLLANKSKRTIYIYWGMSHSTSLYTNIAMSWEKEFNNVHYIPVVSSNDHTWNGRVGLVHKAVINDFVNLRLYHVYACGSNKMIYAAKEAFIAQGLQAENFYSDAFVTSL